MSCCPASWSVAREKPSQPDDHAVWITQPRGGLFPAAATPCGGRKPDRIASPGVPVGHGEQPGQVTSIDPGRGTLGRSAMEACG